MEDGGKSITIRADKRLEMRIFECVELLREFCVHGYEPISSFL